MHRAVLAFGLTAALTISGNVEAQPRPDEHAIGSRLAKRVKQDPVKDLRAGALGAQEIARCLVNRRGETVRQVLAATTAEETQRIGKRLMGPIDCFSMTEGNHLFEGRLVSFPPDIMRGMLAEEMVKRQEGKVRQLPVLQPLQQIYVRPWYAATGRDPIVDEMATCVTEVNPGATLALLRTEPYGDGENGAIASLKADFGRCLRAGAKLQAGRQALRAALAEALYQRTQPWAVAPPKPAKATQ